MFSDIVQLMQLVQQNLSQETETIHVTRDGLIEKQRDFIYLPEITSTLRSGMPIGVNPPSIFDLW
jgi:hypothetical protein